MADLVAFTYFPLVCPFFTKSPHSEPFSQLADRNPIHGLCLSTGSWWQTYLALEMYLHYGH